MLRWIGRFAWTWRLLVGLAADHDSAPAQPPEKERGADRHQEAADVKDVLQAIEFATNGPIQSPRNR